VDTWCPLTTTAAPGSPRETPLMHSSSDPSSRTLTGLDCFLRDIRTVMELLLGDENERRDDSRREFTFIVWIAIMAVIADNYAEVRAFSVSAVAALLRLRLVKKRILKNRKRWWKKCYFPRPLWTECGGIIGVVAAAKIHLLGVGQHLHRRVPVKSRRYCWWCRYSIRTLRTRKQKIIKTINKKKKNY